MKERKIVITGGTGFIGQALVSYFGNNNSIAVVTRGKAGSQNNANRPGNEPANQHVQYYHWDGKEASGEWVSCLEGADLVINLAGRTVNCRYDEANKKEILQSRVQATLAIGEAIKKCARPPRLWINAASATIYPHAEDLPQDEYTRSFHDDFSVQVCKHWEAAFWKQSTPATRKVCLRVAITLGHGGVMTPYMKMIRFGLGGRQGNGKQRFSWIHITDLCRIIEWTAEHPETEGVYNAAAPGAVTNSSFMRTLRNSQGRRFGLPAPVWLLKMGAWMIGTETELLLKSRWVFPRRLLECGFRFRFPELADAVADLAVNEGISPTVSYEAKPSSV